MESAAQKKCFVSQIEKFVFVSVFSRKEKVFSELEDFSAASVRNFVQHSRSSFCGLLECSFKGLKNTLKILGSLSQGNLSCAGAAEPGSHWARSIYACGWPAAKWRNFASFEIGRSGQSQPFPWAYSARWHTQMEHCQCEAASPWRPLRLRMRST